MLAFLIVAAVNALLNDGINPGTKKVVVSVLTCVADPGMVDLNSDFVGLGRRNLDVLNAQFLAGLPCHGCFAGDSLVSEVSVPIPIKPCPSSCFFPLSCQV